MAWDDWNDLEASQQAADKAMQERQDAYRDHPLFRKEPGQPIRPARLVVVPPVEAAPDTRYAPVGRPQTPDTPVPVAQTPPPSNPRVLRARLLIESLFRKDEP